MSPNEKTHLLEDAQPKPNKKRGINMNPVCGIDISKEELVATILGDNFKETRKFGVHTDELYKLKQWLKENHTTQTIMESTGIYWIPIYASLEASDFKIVLANPRQVKGLPKRKTDVRDSEWLAHLLRSGLVKPSYVADADLRALRSLTRLRAILVQDQAGYKNKVHKVLQLSNIRLDSEITDIFGKSGRIIIEAIATGESLDKALERCPKSVQKNAQSIKASIMGKLSQADLFALKLCMGMVDEFDVKVAEVDSQIVKYVDDEVIGLLCSVPGVGFVSAAVVVAELGDVSRFADEKAVCSFCGITPSIRQSGKRRWNGPITKFGSKWLRRNLIQCALAAIKVRGDSKFKAFYLQVRARRGHGVAIVALARKMLGVMYHLLVKKVAFFEEGLAPKRKWKAILERDLSVGFEEAMSLLVNAGYVNGS
ncbi:MAG: IS110 family transposase [Candidatus Bathyarchaeota archaeon]|uniref:IS110 family transposase n=1 Tax=Candidatus Bathycorpusculum sp. TaxID=2994959 RepID=UPI00281BCDBC|nr:IS110 family transposase [Candidatus Termiticorpusculum sp.]MCL2257656.1 IS110 family transposase [Candidatus Termiticorpusculum sp.]